MELPQTQGGGGRKATHDFLSLYSSPTTAHHHQDPTPPQAGGYLKTHDFLQPLELGVGKNGENKVGLISPEKPPIPASPPLPPYVERILPGGIGTYSISYLNQRVLKPDEPTLSTNTVQASSTIRNDENSNDSSYTGSGFTLWDDTTAVIKGKTGKENAERHVLREAGGNIVGGQWMSSMLERPSQSSSYKNQSFMDMITSAKNDEEEDDDDDEEEFGIKREHSSHFKDNLSVKVEAKTIDQKPNTPRSKHSATEQRRRSKINDRFQKLREIIPKSDQKRDKASFLLEVIDYVQFLKEKVNKCESSYNVHEPSKTTQWRNHHIGEGFRDNARGANTESTKFDENKAIVSPNIPINGQNLADSDINNQSGISTVYSQGLLNTLRQALQSSGVDLSQANISVQIDLGKRANHIPNSSAKDDKVPASLQGEEFGQALKRLRTS